MILVVIAAFVAFIPTSADTGTISALKHYVYLATGGNTVKELPAGTTSQVRTDARAGTVTALSGRRKIRLDDAHTFSSTAPQIVYAYLNTTSPVAAQGIPFWNGHPLELEVDDGVVVKWLIDGATPSVIVTQFAD